MVEMCLPRWTYALEEITGAEKDSFGGQHLELATLAEKRPGGLQTMGSQRVRYD